MSSMITIFRREFKSYFISPIGYVYIVAFLLINCGLYVTGFFARQPQALEMRSFFGNLPIVLCVFLPLVTMRLWAEERKSNTHEMLLTFPMPTWSIVGGKFLASLAFFAVALAGTFILPIMLVHLGETVSPDMGQIVSSYLGVLLLGAMFLSLGLFLSGLVSDQIVAAVLGVLACFGVYLLGLDFIAGAVDAWWPEYAVGTLLKRYLGVGTHYDTFTRGVFEVGHLLYFVVWTGVFLMFNGLFVEGRNRPGARAVFATAVALGLAVGLGVNAMVAGRSLGRIDMTEGNIYSLSPVSRDVLKGLDVDVVLTYYASPAKDLPTHMKSLERDVMDRLNELALLSGGRVRVQKQQLETRKLIDSLMRQQQGEEAEKDEDGAEALEQRMLEKGLEPIPVSVAESAGSSLVFMYSAIGIAYKDKEEKFVTPVMPGNLEQLEYRLVNNIFRLSGGKKPVVALVAPIDEMPPYMRMMYMQMGRPVPPPQDNYSQVEQLLAQQDYDVKRVKLTKEEPLPEQYDILVVIEPRQLNDRQQWEIGRALAGGKPTFIAASSVDFREQQASGGLQIDLASTESGIERVLDPVGVTLDDRALLAPEAKPLPYYLTATDILKDSPVVGHVRSLMMPEATAVRIDRDKVSEHKLKVVELVQSPSRTVARPVDMLRTAGQEFFNFRGATMRQYPLMVKVTGRLPFAFKGQERPAWPETPQQPGMPPQESEPEGPAPELRPAEGELVLASSSMMFIDPLIQQMPQPMEVLLNAVDSMGFGQTGRDLAALRGKREQERYITLEDDRTAVTVWKAVAYVGIELLVVAVGVFYITLRAHGRRSYTRKHLAGQS